MMATEITWDQFAARYQTLLEEKLTDNVDDWLFKWSELSKELYEIIAELGRNKNENTADELAAQLHSRFFNEIMPKMQIFEEQLRQKLLTLNHWQPKADNERFFREMQVESQIYREENLPLMSKIEDLTAEYEKITGQITIKMDDKELTLPQARKLLLEPDRELREKSWQAVRKAQLDCSPSIDNLMLELLSLRHEIAKNAGFNNFRDYLWQEYHRFDYQPQDCQVFIDSVEKKAVPLANNLLQEQQNRLALTTLRPWDKFVDSHLRSPLHPFKDGNELEVKTGEILEIIDSEMAKYFDKMRGLNGKRKFLDLNSRKNKALGGYCSFFPKSGSAYIFMNAAGTQEDVDTMFHEVGHSMHAMISMEKQALIWNYNGPFEFCEVTSMAMELLALPHLADSQAGFYDGKDYTRVKKEKFKDIVSTLVSVAHVYAFQDWLYGQNPSDLTINDIDQKWFELSNRFDTITDRSGLEDSIKKGWQGVPHTFVAPLYYIAYGFAQIGALQIWQNSLKNKNEALKKYKEALALGGTKSLPELYQAAGAKFTFDQETIGELMQLLEQQIDLLN